MEGGPSQALQGFPGLGFWGFRKKGFGVLDFGFWVLGFGFRVSGLGFRV